MFRIDNNKIFLYWLCRLIFLYNFVLYSAYKYQINKHLQKEQTTFVVLSFANNVTCRNPSLATHRAKIRIKSQKSTSFLQEYFKSEMVQHWYSYCQQNENTNKFFYFENVKDVLTYRHKKEISPLSTRYCP